jgi:hypothetical protein
MELANNTRAIAQYILPPFGPTYPDLGPTVAKFRRRASQVGGLREMSPAERAVYAEAIEQKIKALQRAALLREGTPIPPPTIFGKKLAEHHRATLLSYPAKVRRARTDDEWKAMYEAAMKEKRKREKRK